jgi:hypothetical protein
VNLKTIIKAAIAIAVIITGIQFSMAYVNFVQLKSIMESEALDARRANTGEEELIRRIRHRAEGSNVHIPEEEYINFTIEGLGDKSEDLVVTAEYDEEVNLFVHVVVWPRTIIARADAPDRD